tara:strand:+ start:287 stop:421 length:135 start_codon:yes stop_codon:yes gene_type:complete
VIENKKYFFVLRSHREKRPSRAELLPRKICFLEARTKQNASETR